MPWAGAHDNHACPKFLGNLSEAGKLVARLEKSHLHRLTDSIGNLCDQREIAIPVDDKWQRPLNAFFLHGYSNGLVFGRTELPGILAYSHGHCLPGKCGRRRLCEAVYDDPSGIGHHNFRNTAAESAPGVLRFDNTGNTTADPIWTELPPQIAAVEATVAGSVLLLTNSAHVGLTSDIKVGDLFVRPDSLLRLNGHTLRVDSYKHPDWGDEAWVVYDGGQIIWREASVLIVR